MKSRAIALRIAVAAMLVALSLVASMLPSLPGPITKFTGFPLLLAGLLVGPRTAFAVGCLTDLIGFAVRPTGPFFPGFTLTQGLTAMIPALFTLKRDPLTWRSTRSEEQRPVGGTIGSYLRLLGIFAVTQVITSVVMVSFFRWHLFNMPLDVELVHRALAQAAHVPLYALMALLILQALSQRELFKRLLTARR